MITFHAISLHNIALYRDISAFPLSSQGLVAVSGYIGSGKTSLLLEAPRWILFGDLLRKATADEVVKNRENEGWGSIEFTTSPTRHADGHAYTVTRARNVAKGKSTLMVTEDGQPQRFATIALAQKYINSIISPRAFDYTVLFGSGLIGLLNTKDEDRKALVAEMMMPDLDFGPAHKRAKERRQETEEKLAQEQNDWDKAETQAETTKQQLAATLADRDRQVSTWQACMAEAERKAAACDHEIERATTAKTAAEAILSEATASTSALHAEVEKLNAEMVAETRVWRAETEQINALSRQIERDTRSRNSKVKEWQLATAQAKKDLAHVEATLDQSHKELATRQAAHEAAKAAAEARNAKIHEAELKAAGLRADLNAKQAQCDTITKAMDSNLSLCPTCGQPADEDHLRTTLDPLLIEVAAIEAQLIELVKFIRPQQAEAQEDARQLKQQQDALSALSLLISRSERTQATLTQTAALPSPAPELDAALASLQAQLDTLNATHDAGQATIPAALDHIAARKAELATAQAQLSTHQRAVCECQATLSRLQGDRRVLTSQLAAPSPAIALEASIARLTAEHDRLATLSLSYSFSIPALESQLREYQIWEQAFHKDGLPALALTENIGRLNRAIETNAQAISEGELHVQLVIDERNALVPRASWDGCAPSYNLFSQGQRNLAAIAVFLAIRDLSAVKCNFAGIDELLDAIDEIAVPPLLRLMVKKTGGEGSVFVISHRDDILEMMAGEEGMQARRLRIGIGKDGGSEVEWMGEEGR